MLIDWTDEFEQMLNRIDEQIAAGNADAVLTRRFVMHQLDILAALDGEPDVETADLRPVRQSRDHLVWRLSHPFHPDKAVRTIVWFPDREHVVVALFANDKARMGDVFYDSVARHEALFGPGEVRDLPRLAVAAAGQELRAA